MRSALLLSTAVSVIVLLAFAREAFAAERVPPPGLIRGVMTDDVKALTELGANSCMLWGPPGKPEAWDKLAEAKQFVLLGSLGSPKKEFFELEGKKRVRMTTPYCWSNDFGAWWIQDVAEAAAKKYPAVYVVTPDEFQWNNGIIPYLFHVPQPVGTKFYCDCDKCRAGAGGKLPEITASRFLANTPESRAYIAYRYKAVADAMKASLDEAKKADPNFLSYYCLNLKEVMNYERYPSGIALDMLPQTDILLATCFQASVDRRGDETRFIPAITTKHLLAARPRFGALPCLAATVYNYAEKFDWTQDYYWRKEIEDLLPKPALESIQKDLAPYKLTDDEVILPALSAIAHGAKGVMFFGDEKKDALKRLFALMAKLEKPLAGAIVPGEVVVLVSRTSEDEWMLAHAPKVGPRADLTDAMVQSGCWAQPADRIAWEFSKDSPASQGFRSNAAVMESLIRLGIPYQMQFTERLRADDLAKAKAVLVPFCTHLSEAAAEMLREHTVEQKTILFGHRPEFADDGGMAEGVWGDVWYYALRHPRLLIGGEASDHLGKAPARAVLAKDIGDVFDVHATCASEDVERAWLNLPDGGVALFLINWSDKPQSVQVRLPGAAKASMLDTAGNSAAVDATCTIDIPARDARILIQSGPRR